MKEWKAAGAKNPTASGSITVASQENDPASLLNYTRKLIALRKAEKPFWASSTWTPVFTEGTPYPMVYTRSDGDSIYLVALNPTGVKKTVTIAPMTSLKKGTLVPEVSEGKVTYKISKKGDVLTMGPTSVMIVKIR